MCIHALHPLPSLLSCPPLPSDVVHKAMDAATKRCAALLAARGGTMPAATLRREEALKLEDLLHVLRREPHK